MLDILLGPFIVGDSRPTAWIIAAARDLPDMSGIVKQGLPELSLWKSHDHV
jgi:hypothetical protein